MLLHALDNGIVFVYFIVLLPKGCPGTKNAQIVKYEFSRLKTITKPKSLRCQVNSSLAYCRYTGHIRGCGAIRFSFWISPVMLPMIRLITVKDPESCHRGDFLGSDWLVQYNVRKYNVSRMICISFSERQTTTHDTRHPVLENR